MPLSKEIALNILGLPIFATPNDILLRYKVLSLMWFPEIHCNYECAVQEFSNITQAAIVLLFPEKKVAAVTSVADMYGFFQYIFFGSPKDEEDDVEYDSDECSAPSITGFKGEAEEVLKAAFNAQELIEEEERGKVKAEKRKAKKKKRKEKKKSEKLEKEIPTEKDTPMSKARSEDPKSPESEEDLDTSSAFVSVIAKKHKVPGLQSKENTVSNFAMNGIPKEDPQSIVLRSRQLALRGNEMASLEHFLEAIELFSEAIKLDPSDHRFYGNRSYCYDMLHHYEKALKDAEKSLMLSPKWPKGHFRKGRALLGLKNHALAEKCFAEVLKYDKDCEDAVSELHNTRVLQIMEKGFTKERAESAMKEHGSLPKAMSSLLGLSYGQKKTDADIFISDDESDSIWASVKNAKLTPHAYDIKTDPTNPEGHKSLWIGNVQPDVTEKKLLSMFSKFGDLINVRVLPEKHCAFVNYKNKSSPGKAMQTYQGFELSGRNLYIRFPNLPGEELVKKKVTSVLEPTKVKASGSVSGNECYFFRTSGCVYGDQCRYQHIKEHKGIDKKK